jgi:hypothetical protein
MIDEDPFSKSEFTMLFFDYINCPFVSDKSKRNNYAKFRLRNKNLADKIKEITDQKIWFMNWDTEIDLRKSIKEKRMGFIILRFGIGAVRAKDFARSLNTT